MFGIWRLCLLALILPSLLTACNEPRHDVLRFGLQSAPVTLDPRFATDASSARINRLIYWPLVDFDHAFQPVPALARWERIDPTHYRFTLGTEGRIFHDGDRLTAADVRATYLSILDPATASPHRKSLNMIMHVETPDADTVDFYLSHPEPLFPGFLVIGILPAKLIAVKHPFSHAPVGSGPFRFVAWPEEGRLQLKRVADGHALEFLKVPDPTVRVLKLLRGEIDMLQNDLPPELVGYVARRTELQVLKGRGSNFGYLGFNMQDPVAGRLEVRQAIAYALDRAAIIRYVLGGAARPADALFPREHWAGDPVLRGYPHDPARARALLAAAGYGPGHPAHIVYKTSSDPFRIRLATIIQQQLAEVGIEVELRSYDWGTFYGDIQAGRFQMYSLAWVGIKTPDIFKYALHSRSVPPAGANRGRFQDPEMDRLIEAADATADPAAYRKIEERMLARLPYVPLWYEDHVFVSRRDIKGYTVAADGNYDGLSAVRRQD